MELALTGRLTLNRDSIDINTTPTGFAPAASRAPRGTGGLIPWSSGGVSAG